MAVTLTVGMVRHKPNGDPLTDGKPALALDLEGGYQIILNPKADEGATRQTVTQEDIDQAIEIIRQRVDASGVAEAEIATLGGDNIMVSLPGQPSEETLDLVRKSAHLVFRPVLARGAPEAANPAKLEQAEAEVKSENKDKPADAKQSDADKKAEASANAKKLMTVDPKSLSDEVKGKPENASDTRWITPRLQAQFLQMDCTKPENRTGGDNGDPKRAVVACDSDGQSKFILGPIELDGVDIKSATSGQERIQGGGTTGRWVVSLQFDNKGTEIFGKISTRLLDFDKTDPTRNAFAIVLDGIVVSYPRINQPILTGQAEISGSFTQKSAATLANQLKFGSLPLNFDPQSEQKISATLGSDQLRYGIWAGVIGMILVVLVLFLQYRGLGIVAVGSLIIAAVLAYLTITLLSWGMGYRLSLAGVAGLIVSIGVTADSFIVYFERIRDEVRDGRRLNAAVNIGWTRAKRTILASDAINLLAALVLYFLAVGGVQGFAFTLGVMTIIDLMVVFMFSHPMLVLLLKIPFFGNGHKLSGLDPQHLGATNNTYIGRGQFRSKTPKVATSEGSAK